jgi:hypothetical protein
VKGLSLFQPFPQRVHDPFFFREFAGFELRIDEFAVEFNLEAAAFGWNELQVADLLFEGGEQFGRQTDGLRFVISHRTVLKFHIHDLILLCWEQYNSMQ